MLQWILVLLSNPLVEALGVDVLHASSAAAGRDQLIVLFLSAQANSALVGLITAIDGTNGDQFCLDSQDLDVLHLMHL